MLDIALALAAAGHRVVLTHSVLPSGECTCGRSTCPESTRGKHPIQKAWQRTASDEEQAIRDQFASLRFTPNVGVVLGEHPSGRYIVALDIDDATRLASLELVLGELPPTRTGRSPRGERRFYEFVGDAASLKNVTGLRGAPGVDMKCAGGQVVVAGRNSRGEYTLPDLTVAIVELPSAWTQALLPVPAPPREHSTYDPSDKRARGRAEKWLRSAIVGEAIHVSRASEGTRNTVLHTSACRVFPAVVGVNGSMLEARSELASAARAAGLPDAEIQKTLDSAERWIAEQGHTRTPPTLRLVTATYEEPPPDIELVMDDGKPAKIAENVARMLTRYPGGGPRLDEFADRIVWPTGRALRDTDASVVQGWLHQQSPRVKAGPDTTWAGILLAAERASFHPVRTWMAGLRWDGRARLDGLFPSYFGSDDSPYTRAVGAQFLIAMVARIRTPGCQVDTMPVLEGEQGVRKSSALRALAGDWFVDSPIDLNNKDAMQNLQGTWLQELGELEKLTAGHMAKLKAFVTQREDKYRPSYGRATVVRLRSTCFAATTNAGQYLTDDTGGRRFRPVKCGAIDLPALQRDREQLWAEAAVRHGKGEPWWFDAAMDTVAAEIVDERYQHDSWEERLSVLLIGQTEVTAGWALGQLGVEVGRQTKADAMRLSVVIKRLGWEKVRQRTTSGRLYKYVRSGLLGR